MLGVVAFVVVRVRSLWPILFALGGLLGSVVPYLAWGFKGRFVESKLAYDNLLAVILFVVLGGMFGLWRRRKGAAADAAALKSMAGPGRPGSRP